MSESRFTATLGLNLEVNEEVDVWELEDAIVEGVEQLDKVEGVLHIRLY